MSVPVSVAARFRVAGEEPLCVICFFAEAEDHVISVKIAEACKMQLMAAAQKVLHGSSTELLSFIEESAASISREFGLECHGYMPTAALTLRYRTGNPPKGVL